MINKINNILLQSIVDHQVRMWYTEYQFKTTMTEQDYKKFCNLRIAFIRVIAAITAVVGNAITNHAM